MTRPLWELQFSTISLLIQPPPLQGNSLLFLPNVLKVYLENGQTKAFKFEANTTVKVLLLNVCIQSSLMCGGIRQLSHQRRISGGAGG